MFLHMCSTYADAFFNNLKGCYNIIFRVGYGLSHQQTLCGPCKSLPVGKFITIYNLLYIIDFFFFFALSLPLWLLFTLCLCISVSLYLCISIFLYLCISLSLCLFVSLSLCLFSSASRYISYFQFSIIYISKFKFHFLNFRILFLIKCNKQIPHFILFIIK
jgi:hypothetical protein